MLDLIPWSSRDLILPIVAQIMALDIVFSLDSVITAVGMARHLEVMAAAVVLAVVVMLVFAGPVGDFVQLLNMRMDKRHRQLRGAGEESTSQVR